jgi:hypothetical protein
VAAPAMRRTARSNIRLIGNRIRQKMGQSLLTYVQK